jgi:hypothetical protein
MDNENPVLSSIGPAQAYCFADPLLWSVSCLILHLNNGHDEKRTSIWNVTRAEYPARECRERRPQERRDRAQPTRRR